MFDSSWLDMREPYDQRSLGPVMTAALRDWGADRQRTRVVGNFPDGKSALMLVAARLRHVAGTRWGTRRYMDMERLREQEQEEQATRVA